jgi:hypothetical protein
MIERITQALRLTPSDTDYLFSLSGIPRTELAHDGAERVDQYIQDTLDSFQAGPALLASPIWDVLAYNRLADLVFEFDDCRGPFARNHIWRLFMDPKRRAKYLGWETLADVGVRALRSAHGKMPEDDYFNSMVRDLCDGSKVFQQLWAAQLTAPPLGSLEIGMKIPRLGIAHFTSVRFRSLDSQQVLALLLPVDEKSAHLMQALSRGKRIRKKKK